MTLVLLSCIVLALGPSACSPGYSGTAKIAFVRDGQLWTIYPDGSGAYQVAGNTPPVVGAGWSPDHHLLVFRTLDSDYAQSAAGRHLKPDPLTGLVSDLPAGLNTVGVDGGFPIPIFFSSASVRISDAWWNPAGNRLLYRLTLSGSASFLRWELAQNDQPGGIATRTLPASLAIPSLGAGAGDILGIDERGLFSLSASGTGQRWLTRGLPPGHPLPATLERVLWQPRQAQPAFLYAASAEPNGSAARVALLLQRPTGEVQRLLTCSCQQFAWSSDGQHVLTRTADGSYLVLNLDGSLRLTIRAEADSVPYWSPDGRFLLLDGRHTLWLIDIQTGRQQLLLSDRTPLGQLNPANSKLPGVAARLQPVPASLWEADSRAFVFLTRGRLWWQGGSLLREGNGLYLVTLGEHGQPQAAPHLLASGAITQVGWTYQESTVSFLF
ncbi:TolB family protein [Thermogemmatispora sp.]|uniref:TolB family protein n=1 Tax=Thermogemmatispora sp. TaxID=1968838 RepID=UPI0035E44F2A